MPHCIVEYSSDLSNEFDIEALIETVHHSSLNTGLFAEGSIKCRAAGYPHYLVGAEKKHFIHVTIKILAGRTIEQKMQLGQLVQKDITNLVNSSASVSVEIVDLAVDAYFN
ncbi:MAG: 5-carboxymethyl-2-hydroxymuconate Delta-isomerase [Methyloligellaceae bacterium]